MKTKLFLFILLTNSFFSFAGIKKDPPIVTDTLKGIHSNWSKSDYENDYYYLNKREFWFPQYFICEAAKKNKLKIWSPESNAWTGNVEFEKLKRDSLFWRKKDVTQYDDYGNEITKETSFYQVEGFVCNGYSFSEEFNVDINAFKIKTEIKGISLIINNEAEFGLMDRSFFYYVPPNQNSICNSDFLLLKNQTDTLKMTTLSDRQKKSLNAILMNCIDWSVMEKRIMFQNGKQLTKKEAKKLFKKSKENGILGGTKEIRIKEDWFFDPATCAFQKEIKQLKVISETGEELFSFGF